jgi:hypothetical protein
MLGTSEDVFANIGQSRSSMVQVGCHSTAISCFIFTNNIADKTAMIAMWAGIPHTVDGLQPK